jgi:hypothetical protein
LPLYGIAADSLQPKLQDRGGCGWRYFAPRKMALTAAPKACKLAFEGKRRQTQGSARPMYTAEDVRLSPPPAIRLRPVPRCDPPFDDELPADARAPVGQLTFPWPRGARPARSTLTASGGGAPTGIAQRLGVGRTAEMGATAAAMLPDGTAAPGTSGDARFAVRRFVSVCVEVLNGYRPAAHLRRLSMPAEALGVVAQGVAGARRVAELRRTARPADRRARRPGPVGVLRVLVSEPRLGAVEVAVLLITGERTWAMAFRLELHQQRWAATALRLI